MKQDVGDAPEQIPRKRRQLADAPDLWIAQWLAREGIAPSDRRKLEEEKRQRRAANPEVVVGFTGTREGMTKPQRRRVRELVVEYGPKEGHHGDCEGGDEQFHSICRGEKVFTVAHPPKDSRWRAFCSADRTERVKDFLDRNKDIVQESTVLIAAPKEEVEPAPAQGQGTWSTVRYARKRGIPVRVVLPSGQLQGEQA
jgi:hypothetical protein